jgi:hypothetical protein
MNGATILVVEDEPLVRDVVAQMLRRAGYAVVAAGLLIISTTDHGRGRDAPLLQITLGANHPQPSPEPRKPWILPEKSFPASREKRAGGPRSPQGS